MPRATVDVAETQRHELKTCPDGYVVLRAMTYGEYLKRRDMLSNMRLKGQGKDSEAIMDMATEKVAIYEFSKCIVEHNLEDDKGDLLNFRNPNTFNQLNPRIGEEISTLIGKMNNYDEGDEEGN